MTRGECGKEQRSRVPCSRDPKVSSGRVLISMLNVSFKVEKYRESILVPDWKPNLSIQKCLTLYQLEFRTFVLTDNRQTREYVHGASTPFLNFEPS